MPGTGSKVEITTITQKGGAIHGIALFYFAIMKRRKILRLKGRILVTPNDGRGKILRLYKLFPVFPVFPLLSGNKKTREPTLTIDSLLGGGYLRLPASLTIVVVTLRALCQEREVK